MTIKEIAKKQQSPSFTCSKLMKELIDAPPSPQTIEKLSAKPHNGISYEDPMKAAGYHQWSRLKD